MHATYWVYTYKYIRMTTLKSTMNYNLMLGSCRHRFKPLFVVYRHSLSIFIHDHNGEIANA